MGRAKKSSLRPSSPLWSKPLPFLAVAVFGGVMMLPELVTWFSIRHRFRALELPLHDTYYVLDSPSVVLMFSFLVGLFVLMAGITMALVVYAQNCDTSQPASRRDASKKQDVPNAVHAIFDFVSLLVPRRLANEELGDALEVINREVAKRRPRWRIWLKVGTTLFWITINSLRWARGAFRGRRRFR